MKKTFVGLQKIKQWFKRKAFGRAGYSECHGVFRITDSDGRLLDDVAVSYRVGEGEWISCGKSASESALRQSSRRGDLAIANFVQPTPVFHEIGETVFWRFRKPGCAPKIAEIDTTERHREAIGVVVLECEGARQTDSKQSINGRMAAPDAID